MASLRHSALGPARAWVPAVPQLPARSPAVTEPARASAVAMAFLECHKCPGSIQIDLRET